MWKQFIINLCSHCKIHEPLAEEWIDKGLAEVEVLLNDSLKSFLLESDGLYDYKQFLWIIWNVRDLLGYNQAMRTQPEYSGKGYRFDDIFFIANAGEGGILYGFPIVSNIMQDNVVAWQPTSNTRTPLADNLEIYLRHWIKDTGIQL